MIVDIHSHSHFSYDGNDPFDQIFTSAQARGIGVLAVTDHCDIRDHKNGHAGYLATLKERQHAFHKAKDELVAAGSSMVILDGVEIGDIGNDPDLAEEHLHSYPYDVVLGSVHHALDDSPVNVYRDDPLVIVEVYFEEMERLVEWGHFDSLAHLDYPTFHWRVTAEIFTRFEPQIDRLLMRLAQKEKALEVNASGLFRDVGRLGPERWVLERFKEHGGKYITVGSDSHLAKHIGRGIEEAYELIRQAGFDQIVYYKSRKPIAVDI